MIGRHLVAAIAVSLALSLPRLSGDLYGDERGHTLRYVGGGAWSDIVRDPGLVHPPLYFLLAKASVAAVGRPWAMRLPSLLAALALVPVAAGAARRLLGGGFAAPAAWGTALSPFVLEFATEGRAYALLLLFSALSLIAFLDFLEQETPWRAVALAAALAGGAITHFAFLPQAAFFGAWYLARRRGVTRAGVGVAAAFTLAVAPFLALQAAAGPKVTGMLQGGWSGGLGQALALPARVAVALLYGYDLLRLGRLGPGRDVGLAALAENLPVVAAMVAVLFALALSLLGARGERRRAVVFCAAGALFPVATAATGGVFGWYLVREKHLAVAWVFALLLTLAALDGLRGRRWLFPVVAAHCALIGLSLFNATFRAETYSRRMNWAGLAAALGGDFGVGDRLVSYAFPIGRLTDRPLPVGGDDPREVVLLADMRARGTGLPQAVDRALAGVAGRVVVVYEETGRNLVDPGDLLLGRLRAERRCTERAFGRNLALWSCVPREAAEGRP